MSLRDLCTDATSAISAIADYLGGLSASDRLAETRSLDRDAQRRLYDKAAGAPPLGLDHFTGDAGALEEVIHEGTNTLPVPAPLRRFQKRFCRPTGEDTRLHGYNEGLTRRFVGPGYFIAESTSGRAAWELRGAVVIDYFQVPEGPVPAGWPPVVDNDHRLSRLVYHQTRDFMRGVSAHVSIGAAYKRERPLDHYFVLCKSQY